MSRRRSGGPGFVDIHCHVLPGIDDGSASLEESIAMCRIAARDGIAVTAATPHVREDKYPNTPGRIREALDGLRRALAEEGVEHEVVSGGEVHLRPDLGRLVEEGGVPTYADRGRHLLLELPDVFPDYAAEEAAEGLIARGIVPVIAHPERCETLVNRPELLYRLVRAGALSQVTGLSLDGTFGRSARSAARRFVRAGLAHFLASDAHSTRRRRPELSRAYRLAVPLVGEKRALRLVAHNPRAVVEGGEVEAGEPEEPDSRGGFLSRLLGD